MSEMGQMERDALPVAPRFQPAPGDVAALIEDAVAHGLVGFLVEGQLGAVAAAFGVHAFTVEEARRQLLESGR